MRHKERPTHRWLVANNIMRWLALTFLFVLLIVFIAVWTVTYTIRRDCTDAYHRNLKFPGYWLQIEAGSNKPGCPKP